MFNAILNHTLEYRNKYIHFKINYTKSTNFNDVFKKELEDIMFCIMCNKYYTLQVKSL